MCTKGNQPVLPARGSVETELVQNADNEPEAAPDTMLFEHVGYPGSFHREHSSLRYGAEKLSFLHIPDSKDTQATIGGPDADSVRLESNADSGQPLLKSCYLHLAGKVEDSCIDINILKVSHMFPALLCRM